MNFKQTFMYWKEYATQICKKEKYFIFHTIFRFEKVLGRIMLDMRIREQHIYLQ